MSTKFKIELHSRLQLLKPEAMKLLRSAEEKISKDKNGENEPGLKITGKALFHYITVNSQYHHDSSVLSTLVSNKSFDQLLNFSPTNNIYSETFWNFHALKYGLLIKNLWLYR